MQRIPQIWPGWQVDELIGRGAYGKVYQASNDAGEQAAIKVIEIPQDEMEVAELQRMGMDALSVRLYFEDTARAVSNEIKVMERLRDAPHIVRIQAHELIERETGVGWSVFIRMELLEPLVRRLDEEGLPSPQEAARIGRDLCDALQCCHEKGIIHRDVKPENVFRSATGAYKLGDFGIAKRMDTATRSTMSFAGSRPYMAPEVESGHYDESVDTYSLGLMMYRWLNGGRPPFLPATGSVTQQQIQRADLDRLTFKKPPLPTGEGADPVLGRIVLRAIAPHAQERWKSAEAFGKALQAWLDGAHERVQGGSEDEPLAQQEQPQPQPHEDDVTIPAVEKAPYEPQEKVSETVRNVTPIASDVIGGMRNADAKAKPSVSLPVPPRILAVAAAVLVALIVVVLCLPGPTIVDPPSSGGGSSSSTSTTSSSKEDTKKESSSTTASSTSSSKTNDTSSSSSTTEGKTYQAPHDPSIPESDSSTSQTDSSSSSSSSTSSSSNSGTHQVDTTSITHYDCGYFSIDVPESWKGSWTLVEGPGDQWSVWSFYAGQAVLKLGNGNTKEYEIVGTVDYGNGEPIGLMMDNDGFFGDGLATLSPNYY